MKKHHPMFVAMLMALSVTMHAQDNAAPAEPAQSDMQKWIATTDAQWQAAFKRDVTDAHEAELSKLKLQYLTSLETGIAKASAASDLAGAVALRDEQKRFGDTNVFPEKDEAADAAPVKQLRAAIRLQIARLEKERDARAKALLAKYDQVLAQAQSQLTQRQRLDDALLVKAQREEAAAAWATPANAAGPEKKDPAAAPAAAPGPQTNPPPRVLSNIEKRFYAALAEAAARSDREETKKSGGHGGGEFTEVRPEGGLLVGFEVWRGNYAGHLVIRGIRPIFQTAAGRLKGKGHGNVKGEPGVTVEAKEGYAVAAIEARGGDRLDGFEVLFWKIPPSMWRLNAEGSYKSEWIGGKGGGKSRHPLGSNGQPVLGIFGASGAEVDRMGLIYAELR